MPRQLANYRRAQEQVRQDRTAQPLRYRQPNTTPTNVGTTPTDKYSAAMIDSTEAIVNA